MKKLRCDFGAIGDGVANDTAAVIAAFMSGHPLDGEGLVYGVLGQVNLPAGLALYNCTFRQLAPGASLSVKTLVANGVSNLTLENVKVDRNGSGDNGGLLNAAGVNGALNTAIAIEINGGTGHYLKGLEVFGSDSGSGILLSNLDGSSRVIEPYCHDMNWMRIAATDDQVQGIWLNKCTDLTVYRPKAERMKGNFLGAPARRFSRGVVMGGCKRVTIVEPLASVVDQGVDITGGPDINEDCHVIRPRTDDCYLFGVKLANTAVKCTVVDGKADNCGNGFVANGNSGLTNTTRLSMFIGCEATRPSANGQNVVAKAGFRLFGETGNAAAANTFFIRCTARDEQAVKTMDYGFLSDITDPSIAPYARFLDSYGHRLEGARGIYR